MSVADHGEPIVVALVAAVRLHGEGLSSILEQDAAVVVAGAAPPAEDLCRTLSAWHPDVVLLDAGATENLLVAHQIARGMPGVRTVAVAEGPDDHAMAYAEAGVLGFLERDATPQDLQNVVHAVARGEACFPGRLVSALINRVESLVARTDVQLEGIRLTRRETQIIELIDHGLSNRQIAAVFQVELSTVKNHVHNILKKLDVHSRAEAVEAWHASSHVR